jgi:hypothetical protein
MVEVDALKWFGNEEFTFAAPVSNFRSANFFTVASRDRFSILPVATVVPCDLYDTDSQPSGLFARGCTHGLNPRSCFSSFDGSTGETL